MEPPRRSNYPLVTKIKVSTTSLFFSLLKFHCIFFFLLFFYSFLWGRAILARIKALLCAFSSRSSFLFRNSVPSAISPPHCSFSNTLALLLRKAQVYYSKNPPQLLPASLLTYHLRISRMNRFRAVTCMYLPPIRFLIPCNPMITISRKYHSPNLVESPQLLTSNY